MVLQKGEITEVGTHESLTRKRGEYYNLVKNQLELGNWTNGTQITQMPLATQILADFYFPLHG